MQEILLPNSALIAKFSIDEIFKMNILAGMKFLIFLIIFGSINYLFMMKRFNKDNLKKKYNQLEKISKLYPKGSFIKT